MTDFNFRPVVNPAKGALRAALVSGEKTSAVDSAPDANSEYMRGKLPVDQAEYIDPRAIDDHYSGARKNYIRNYFSNIENDAARVARVNRGMRGLEFEYKDRIGPRTSGFFIVENTEQYVNARPDVCGCDIDFDSGKSLNIF